jgi:transcriptional regulator with XRE-family HTH domain
VFYVNFGLRIKHLRLEKGLTQEELAGKLGLKKSTISLYESNGRQPDYETLIKLADIFGVTIDGLFGRGDLFPLTDDERTFLDHYKSLPVKEKNEAESYLKFLKLKRETNS